MEKVNRNFKNRNFDKPSFKHLSKSQPSFFEVAHSRPVDWKDYCHNPVRWEIGLQNIFYYIHVHFCHDPELRFQ